MFRRINLFRLFLPVFALTIFFSGCQLKSSDEEKAEDDNNQQSDTDQKNSSNNDIILPGNIVLGDLEFDENGQVIDGDFFYIKEKIEENILKDTNIELNVENATFEYKYSPVMNKFIVAVGNRDQFNLFQPYQGLFLVDGDGENIKSIKTLSQPSDITYKNFISAPTFSADQTSEVAWFEKNEEEEEYITRIHIHNIKTEEETSYRVKSPSVVYDPETLVVFRDKIILKTDRYENPFGNTFLTHAYRDISGRNIELNPIPFTFHSDVRESILKNSEGEMDFLGVIASRRKSGREYVYFVIHFTDESDKKSLLLIEQSDSSEVLRLATIGSSSAIFSKNQLPNNVEILYLSKDGKTVSLYSLDVQRGTTKLIAEDLTVSEKPIWWNGIE